MKTESYFTESETFTNCVGGEYSFAVKVVSLTNELLMRANLYGKSCENKKLKKCRTK